MMIRITLDFADFEDFEVQTFCPNLNIAAEKHSCSDLRIVPHKASAKSEAAEKHWRYNRGLRCKLLSLMTLYQ